MERKNPKTFSCADMMIDLHTHSTASDGSMTPRELVAHACASGLKAIALTDHDTMDGLEEALDEADHLGMMVIPGVEISVDFRPEMHILGYFSKKNYRNIQDILEELKKNREERNPKILRKLNELGYEIRMEEVKEAAGGTVIGRPHFAKVLVEKGYFKSTREVFETLLAPGRPAYFKKEKLTPAQGLSEIIKAGGVPVLAHPILMGLEMRELDALLGDMRRDGLKGIEAYYTEHTPEETKELVAMAEKHGLIATGGSDFHGAFKPGIEIGKGYGDLRIPPGVLEELLELLEG